MVRRWFTPFPFAFVAALPMATAHAQPLPAAASGRVIEAIDGDVIVVPSKAQVVVVTRSQVQARLVYIAARQTLLLLTDPALGIGFGAEVPEAKGVRRWTMRNAWPLEPRWEGAATIDEYRPFGLAIHTDRGTIQIGPIDRRTATTPPPVAVVEISSASSRVARGSFDEIEQAWLAGGDNALQGPPGPRAGVQMQGSSMVGGVVAPAAMGSTGGAPPVRVGGNIRPPARIAFVEPAYPAVARSAGVQGVVIIELVIGTDGAISNARVLRSIPLLDQAALDAVRQWRYEPTLLNGAPVPVIMTATVNFSLPPASP